MSRLRVGETLHNDAGTPYVVTGLLGEGGYGETYAGHQLSTSGDRVRDVAIKVCKSLDDWHGEAYFGRLLNGDPRIVELFDAFVTATGRGQRQRRRHLLVLRVHGRRHRVGRHRGRGPAVAGGQGARGDPGAAQGAAAHARGLDHPSRHQARQRLPARRAAGARRLRDHQARAGPQGGRCVEVPARLRAPRPRLERHVGAGRGHLPGRPARRDAAVRRDLVERRGLRACDRGARCEQRLQELDLARDRRQVEALLARRRRARRAVLAAAGRRGAGPRAADPARPLGGVQRAARHHDAGGGGGPRPRRRRVPQARLTDATTIVVLGRVGAPEGITMFGVRERLRTGQPIRLLSQAQFERLTPPKRRRRR